MDHTAHPTNTRVVSHAVPRCPSTIPLTLILIFFLGVSTSACAIAKYDLVSEDSPEGTKGERLQYEHNFYLVIPAYYIMHMCGKPAPVTPCRDLAGAQLHKGVTTALSIAGMEWTLMDHVPTNGRACVVTVNQISPENYTSRLLSMATLFVVPAYTRRDYVLSYDIYLDRKKVQEYRFDITEKALSGFMVWLFAPAVVFQDVTIGQYQGTEPGPMAYVIQKATKQFLQAAVGIKD